MRHSDERRGQHNLYNGLLGGYVKPFPHMTKKQVQRHKRQGDTVPTILQVGEVVVPLKHTRRVLTFLKKNHIKFGNIK